MVPTSVVGVPQSVAVSSDESFAIVTSGTKIDPADPKKVALNNQVSVIDLKASPPAVVQTTTAGMGASGVSINRAGTLALIANRADGTVSIFTIADKKLTEAGKIDFGNDRSIPSHVAITPDGKTALVTRSGDHKISVLSINGGKVEYTKRDFYSGMRPNSLEISSSGAFAVVGNIGMGAGDADTLSLIDLAAKLPRTVNSATVGPSPEGVALSADGAYVAVNVVNGSNRAKDHPFFNDYGLVKVLSTKGNKLTPIAEIKVGHWCQGIAWSNNNRTLLVQCMVEKELQILSFDGRQLRRTGAIKTTAGPAGIRTAGR